MATKFVYSDTDVAEITAQYAAGATLETLATKYNKSVASVRMKLVKLGVYKKAEKAATKTAGVSTGASAFEFPTSKSGILELYNSCVAKVGYAPY